MAGKMVTELKDIFSLFDADRDGTVSRKELRTILQNLGQNPTEAELRAMIKGVDKDDNDSIDFDEFMVLISKKMQMVELDEDILEAFRVLDKDGNGVLSRDELRYAISSLGEKVSDAELDDLMAMADTNHDGNINYLEFAKMIVP